MAAYYNEIDPFTAAWLRELIKAGQIADGEVDERSIADVRPDDLRGFSQCHFFAGIGGWSLALRLAGWPDDRHVWTGSCPCQPFSSAGQGVGGDDPRHLWPTWFRLIAECHPSVVFGEQVESAINHGWFDLVCDDLEREGYAAGAASLPAASVGAFHIRQRLWFVAHAPCGGPQRGRDGRAEEGRAGASGEFAGSCDAGCCMADPYGERRTRERLLLRPEEAGRHAGEVPQAAWRGEVGRLANTSRGDQRRHPGEPRSEAIAGGGEAWATDGDAAGGAGRMGRDFWAACDWLPCTDGKARPVEPGTFPLAHGIPARVGRLRGYGNAIVPQVAAAFIESYCEAQVATPGQTPRTPR